MISGSEIGETGIYKARLTTSAQTEREALLGLFGGLRYLLTCSGLLPSRAHNLTSLKCIMVSLQQSLDRNAELTLEGFCLCMLFSRVVALY